MKVKYLIWCTLISIGLLLAGCGSDDSDDGITPGSRDDPAGCTQLSEREPNNNVSEAQSLGTLRAGSCFRISGNIASTNDLDGQTFTVSGPQSITANLQHDSSDDFGLAFFSRGAGLFVAVCQETNSPEVCGATFTGTSDTLDIIVNSVNGTGNYTLEVTSVATATSISSAATPDGGYSHGDDLDHDGDKQEMIEAVMDQYTQ